jgi:hypothetical protein
MPPDPPLPHVQKRPGGSLRFRRRNSANPLVRLHLEETYRKTGSVWLSPLTRSPERKELKGRAWLRYVYLLGHTEYAYAEAAAEAAGQLADMTTEEYADWRALTRARIARRIGRELADGGWSWKGEYDAKRAQAKAEEREVFRAAKRAKGTGKPRGGKRRR